MARVTIQLGLNLSEDYDAFIEWLETLDPNQELSDSPLYEYRDFLGDDNTDDNFFNDILGEAGQTPGQDYLRAFWLIGQGNKLGARVGDLLTAVRDANLLPPDHS